MYMYIDMDMDMATEMPKKVELLTFQSANALRNEKIASVLNLLGVFSKYGTTLQNTTTTSLWLS